MHPNSMPLVRRETEQSTQVLWPPPLVVPDILEETVEVPDAFKCPITLTFMREPATTREGTPLVGTSCDLAERLWQCSYSAAMCEAGVCNAGLTYDHPAIMRWIEQRNKDPRTAKTLRAKHLSPNFSLRTAMQTWIDMQLHELGIVS